MNKQTESILMLGFGDIAQRLSHQLNTQDSQHSYQITGVRRRQCDHECARVIQGDVLDRDSMNSILSEPYDVIISTMTPSEYSDEGYQAAYVESTRCLLDTLALQTWRPRLILFVSSSGVYGQENAEWVDEDSATEPKSFSGRRLLEAEALLQDSAYDSCIVRFSGIYGPGRQRLIEQVIKGQGAEKTPVLYSNRIHADDCAGVLKHILELDKELHVKTDQQVKEKIAPLYLATDCEPFPLYEVKQWLASQLGLPADHLTTEHLQSKPLGRMIRSSKRCSNQRLLESGYEFRYPTFREGYAAVLANFDISEFSSNE